jgi:ferredoxin
VKILIDRDLCQGHGVCVTEAPDVFRLDEEGSLAVLLEEPPEEHRDAVANALRYCPTGAISLEE